MEASIPRSERAFWADSIGGSSFDLDGERYTDQATVAKGIVSAGDKVLVCPTVDGRGRRQMLILDSKGSSGRRRLTFTPFLAAGYWTQAEGNPGMSRSTYSALIDPAATATTPWTGNADAKPFGICVLSNGTILTAQARRDVDDTFWEAVDLFLINDDPVTFSANLDFSPDTFAGYGEIFSNAGGSLVLISIVEGPQFYRLRSGALGLITFADMDTDNFFPLSLNMGTGGVVTHGAYLRNYASSTSQTGGPRYSVAIDAPLGDNTLTDNVEIQGWAMDVTGDEIAEAWSLDPVGLLTIDRPLLFGCTSPLPAKGDEFRVWASGRQQLDAAGSDEDQNLCNTSLFAFPGGDTSRPNFAPKFARQVQAMISAVSAITGEEIWSYEIARTAAAPILDEGLIGGLTTRLGELGEAQSGAGTGTTASYFSTVGRYTEGQLPSIGPTVTYASGDPFGLYYPGPGFSVPQLSLFFRTGIILLPQPAGNVWRPTLMDELAPGYGDGLIRNFETFTEYGLEESARIDSGLEDHCRNNQTGQLTVDQAGNTYAAYLAPKGLLAGGSLVYNISGSPGTDINSFGFSQNLFPAYWVDTPLIQARWWLTPPGGDPEDATAYIIDATGEPPFEVAEDGSEGSWSETITGFGVHTFVSDQVGHSPDLFHVYERYIIKLSTTGTLLWECDLTQLVAGCTWYMTEISLGGFADAIIGGVATDPIPLGDNIWHKSPAGRVLFALVDYHDLGPNFYPTTKLLILNDSDGSIVHTVPLWINDDVLEDEVFETSEHTQEFVTDGLQYVFALDLHGFGLVASVTEVRVDGTPTSDWFQAGNNVEFTYIPDPAHDISCDYVANDTTKYFEGERRYGIDGPSLEIRSGVAGNEWAAVFVQQVDRTTGSTVSRLVMVETQSTLSSTPTTTQYTHDVTNAFHVAVSGGHLLRITFSGSWKIEQI